MDTSQDYHYVIQVTAFACQTLVMPTWIFPAETFIITTPVHDSIYAIERGVDYPARIFH